MSEPISFLTASLVIAAVGVPLAFGFVPPNKLYGVRTARILADVQLWYRVNRFGGWVLVTAAALSIAIYLSVPQLASGRSFLGLVVFLVPLLFALAAIAVYLRKVTARASGYT